MEEKRFIRVLILITILCAVLTLVHLGYDLWAYQHASIITFIAKEWW